VEFVRKVERVKVVNFVKDMPPVTRVKLVKSLSG